MTCVVWDGKTLAADKRAVNNGLAFTVTKIRKINGDFVAAAGDFSPIMAIFRWYENGADPDKLPECQKDKDRYGFLMVIKPDGTITKYEQDGLPYVIEEKYHAIGCGRDYALGALAMGADARKAVDIACRFDTNCGNGIDTLEFGE